MTNRAKKILHSFACKLTQATVLLTLCLSAYANAGSISICLQTVRSLASASNSTLNIFERLKSLRAEGRDSEQLELAAKTEASLANSRILKISSLGGGVNPSFVIELEGGLKAVYKPVNLARANQPRREVAAYRMSKLLKLDLVPPTVVRKIDLQLLPETKKSAHDGEHGAYGSLQLYVEGAVSLKVLHKNNSDYARIEKEQFARSVIDHMQDGRRIRVFDWLTNNHDRGTNLGNYLLTGRDGEVIGVDHGVAFAGEDKTPKAGKVPYYEKDFVRDEFLVKQLVSVSEAEVRQALEGLNPVRIDEFLIRLETLRRVIERGVQ